MHTVLSLQTTPNPPFPSNLLIFLSFSPWRGINLGQIMHERPTRNVRMGVSKRRSKSRGASCLASLNIKGGEGVKTDMPPEWLPFPLSIPVPMISRYMTLVHGINDICSMFPVIQTSVPNTQESTRVRFLQGPRYRCIAHGTYRTWT